ncbi:MAG: hypothetical protein GY841_16345 [FCB group bacterium]|nr:hypothetical protein [FCB group bacterium]
MGMSTSIVGIRPPGKKWKKMKAIYDSCKDGDIEVPEIVEEFFDYEEPDEKGVIIDLEDIAENWGSEYAEGFEIDTKKLPKDITVIRFYNSY